MKRRSFFGACAAMFLAPLGVKTKCVVDDEVTFAKWNGYAVTFTSMDNDQINEIGDHLATTHELSWTDITCRNEMAQQWATSGLFWM